MKYTDEMVCFQEVPDETALSFSISNCPYHCKGCHSSYLFEDIGIPLLDIIKERLDFHKGLITCVLFMGGDDPRQIEELLECVRICEKYNIKLALYTGAEKDKVDSRIWRVFDYVKVGPYIEALGGLDKETTNQRMYKKENGKWKDITYKFWEKGLKI